MNDERHPGPTPPAEHSDPLPPPAEFEAALRRALGPGVEVPRKIDEAVLAHAAEHLGHRRPRLTFAHARWAAAAAASVAVGIGLWAVLATNGGSRTSPLAADPRDINRDGVVDVLDAYRLAHALDRGESPMDSWDQNGDGRVERADADAIAAFVVQLHGRGS